MERKLADGRRDVARDESDVTISSDIDIEFPINNVKEVSRFSVKEFSRFSEREVSIFSVGEIPPRSLKLPLLTKAGLFMSMSMSSLAGKTKPELKRI